MIQLKVEEYCKNCPEFETYTETETLEVGTLDFATKGCSQKIYNHIVHCKHRERCASMMERLKELRVNGTI